MILDTLGLFSSTLFLRFWLLQPIPGCPLTHCSLQRMCLSSSLSAPAFSRVPSWFLLFPSQYPSDSFSEVQPPDPLAFLQPNYLLLDLEFPTPFQVSHETVLEDPMRLSNEYQMKPNEFNLLPLHLICTYPSESWMSHNIIAQSFWPSAGISDAFLSLILRADPSLIPISSLFTPPSSTSFTFHCSNSGYFPVSHGLSSCRAFLINLSPLKLFPFCPLHQNCFLKHPVHHTVYPQSFQWCPCQ